MARFRIISATLCVTMLVVAACTGAVSPSPSPSASSTPSSLASSPSISASPSPAGLAAPEVSRIRVGLFDALGASISGLPVDVAVVNKLYEKYGLTPEFINLGGDTQAGQALQANQVDVATVSGGSSIVSQATDSPLLAVACLRSNVTDILVTRDDISTADDLKGQRIAVSGLGGASHGSVVLALEALGLTADDVVITQIGGGSERYAALIGGSVAAAPLDGSERQTYLDQGLKILVDLAEEERAGLPRFTMTVQPAFAEQNPNTVLAFVAATLEGVQVMLDSRQLAIDAWQTNSGLSAADAKAAVDAELDAGWAPRDGRCQAENFEVQKSVLASVDPLVADVDVTKAFTNDYVDKLDELGILEAIGVPQ